MSSPPPRPSDEAELGFHIKKPVRWFSPKVLLSTGQRVVLSSAMGDFLDKRELQRSVTPLVIDHNGGDEAWIDYVADTRRRLQSHLFDRLAHGPEEAGGDGTRHRAPPAPPAHSGRRRGLPLGRPRRVRQPLRGPYMAALPYKRTDNPKLLAIPGNHDWYDGLTNFMRLFSPPAARGSGAARHVRPTATSPSGSRRTGGSGVSTSSFDAFIDDPQIQFFKEVAEGMGDQRGRIILCTGKPSWADVKADPDAFRNLGHVAVGVLFVGPVAIKAASWADGFLFSAGALVVLSVLGGLAAAFTMGAYLAVCCACLRTHGNEAFSARANIDFKNFLRLHIDDDGVLTVYPVAVDRSTRKWEFDPGNPDEEASWLTPAPGATPEPRLIEQPIRIDPRGSVTSDGTRGSTEA